MGSSHTKKATFRIVGPVPRSIKDATHVEKVYEAARKEIEVLRSAATRRKSAKS